MKTHARSAAVPSSIFLMAAALIFVLPAKGWPLDIGLLDPHQLHGQLGRWTVLDARPSRDWRSERIPGALSFTWEDHVKDRAGTGSYRVPKPENVAEGMGNMGVDETTPVVVYGDADGSWGGEGWAVWVLSWVGHQGPIRLLDGGIHAWKTLGYPLEKGSVAAAPVKKDYNVNLRPDLDVQATQLAPNRDGQVLIDTRSSFEWMWDRLPSAIHIPWTKFFAGPDRRPLKPEALKQLLQDHGIPPHAPVVYYCTAGVRSGYAWLVHFLSGLPAARNYSGGMSDWRRFSNERPAGRGA